MTRRDGRRAGGAYVRVQRKGVEGYLRVTAKNLLETRVNHDGSFELELPFESLSAFWVYAYPSGDDGPQPDFRDGASLRSGDSVLLEMRTPRALEVEVQDDAGRPVFGAYLTVLPIDRLVGPTHPEPGEPTFKWRHTRLGEGENTWKLSIPFEGSLRVQTQARGFAPSVRAVEPGDERVMVTLFRPNARITVRLRNAEAYPRASVQAGPDDPRFGEHFASPSRAWFKDGVAEVEHVSAPGIYALRVSGLMAATKIVRGIELTEERPTGEVDVALEPLAGCGRVLALGWLDHQEHSPRSFVRRPGESYRHSSGAWSSGRDVEIAPLPAGRYDLCLVATDATHAAVLNDVEIRAGEAYRFTPTLLPMCDFRWPDSRMGIVSAECFWVMTERGHRVPALVHGNRRHGAGNWLIYSLALVLPIGKDTFIRVPGEEATLHWRTSDGKSHSADMERVTE